MENRKIKRFVLFILLSCILSGCGSKSDIISSDLMNIENNEYVSSKLEKGNLAVKIKTEGKAEFPIMQDIYSENDAVIITEIKVKNLELVKKGQLLAEVRPYNAEEIKAKEDTIAKKTNDLANLSAYYNQEETKLRAALNSADNQYDKQIYQIKLDENETNRQYMTFNSQVELEKLNKELEKMKEPKGDCNIYAPFDGIIDKVYISSKNTALTKNTAVFSIHSNDTVFVYIDDPHNAYYGNEVTVTAGNGGNKQTIKGRVVTEDSYLKELLKTSQVAIRLEGDFDRANLDNLVVEMTTYNVGDVAITKSTGVSSIKGKEYVYILEDKILKRRHVITGGADNDNTWILQGINEGDVVYLQ